MPNLHTARAVLTSQAWGESGRRSPHLRRLAEPGRLRLGADDVDALYVDPQRVKARRAELAAAGYPSHVATLAVRAEARENTLLDRTDGPGLNAREAAELRSLQRLLASLDAEHGRKVAVADAARCGAEMVEVEAIDTSTGALALFSVRHDRGAVRAVVYHLGGTCSPGSEQFTEVAEAFAIDYGRQLAA